MSASSSTDAASVTAPSAAATTTPAGIDPRGPQVAAAITTVVLAVALLTIPGPIGWALVAAQAVVFAIGAVAGVSATPYALAFRFLVRPRLAPPSELEDPAPPRFAQTVGLAFAAVALVGLATGVTLLAQIAVGFALAAAFLNAAFRFCLGCEVYLLLQRLRGGRAEGATA